MSEATVRVGGVPCEQEAGRLCAGRHPRFPARAPTVAVLACRDGRTPKVSRFLPFACAPLSRIFENTAHILSRVFYNAAHEPSDTLDLAPCRVAQFTFDPQAIAGDLAAAYRMHGVIEGKAAATSDIQRIAVGRYRDDDDPMQIMSGAPGRELVHYEAPPSREVPGHMQRFLEWFAETAPVADQRDAASRTAIDPLARAAIAHLWFESIHPFEDGNGRLGRTIVDMAVAQHLQQPVRLYSPSRQLLASRSGYYDSLNAAQRGDLDVTAWVAWFVHQCLAAYASASMVIDRALEKRGLWDRTRAVESTSASARPCSGSWMLAMEASKAV